jgi:hypothetical protein
MVWGLRKNYILNLTLTHACVATVAQVWSKMTRMNTFDVSDNELSGTVPTVRVSSVTACVRTSLQEPHTSQHKRHVLWRLCVRACAQAWLTHMCVCTHACVALQGWGSMKNMMFFKITNNGQLSGSLPATVSLGSMPLSVPSLSSYGQYLFDCHCEC